MCSEHPRDVLRDHVIGESGKLHDADNSHEHEDTRDEFPLGDAGSPSNETELSQPSTLRIKVRIVSVAATKCWVGCSAWLDRLQLLAHYITGPLMPNARGEHCPAQA